MKKNEFFGFDEDMEICAIHVWSDANVRKELAERQKKEKEARDTAVQMIVSKIIRFFEYLGYKNTPHCSAASNVWEYVRPAYAADQIIKSCGNANIPDELLIDAAKICCSESNNATVEQICKCVIDKLQSAVEIKIDDDGELY